jgi:phosphatidylcholine synthase
MPILPALVHVLTALGAVCALMAALAMTGRHYEVMFAWLGLAFLIDGIDGPLARAVDIKDRLPRFSGEHLDLIIDYLTYVFIPVHAMLAAEQFMPAVALPVAAGILLSSLFHFADTASKAPDNSFIGFPAIWNVVAFYFFAFAPSQGLATAIALAAIVLTFVPLKWLHPMRVAAWRTTTLLAMAVWLAAAVAVVWSGFAAAPAWALVALAAVAAYALCVPLLASERHAHRKS